MATTTSSSVSWKSASDVVPDKFPAGLRVLVVDDDPICLMVLETMLRKCLYEATKCNRAEVALSLLRENKNGFDIVLSDVHMPDMDGLKLLEHIGLEMDLPVIMMSIDDSKSVAMKGVTHGACDFLIKPVRIEALRNIWQHVVRKKKREGKDFDPSGSVEDVERQQKTNEDADNSSSANEGSWKSSIKRRKDEEEEDEGEVEERDDSSSSKKPRVVWSIELHQQFVAAVNQLGIDKAVPKKILELMNVPGLTRENVASHLQKYRLYLRRLSGSQQGGGQNNQFMGPIDPSVGSMSSINGIELQANGQIQAQSLANLQALGRPGTQSPLSMPPLDQRNLFSFEIPKFQFGDGHPKQMNLLHGIPTNMDSKQLANLHQSSHAFGALGNSQGGQNGPSLMPMGQTQTRHAMLPNGIGSGILGRNCLGNPVLQSSSMVDFSRSQWQNVGLTFDDSQRTNMQGSSFDVRPSVLMSQQSFPSQNRNLGIGNAMFSTGEDSGLRSGTNIGQQINSFLGENGLRAKPERLPEVSRQYNVLPEPFGQEDIMSALLKPQGGGMGSADSEFGFDGYPPDNMPM